MFRGAAALLLLFVSCTSVDDTGSTLSTVEGFCTRWAEAACNDEVATRCAAENVDDCVAGQTAACVERLPEKRFIAKNAKDCLAAVEEAYKDAQLDPVERDIVINLAAPCDQLLSGSGSAGDPCNENADCRTKDGYACVFKGGGTTGECRVPMMVGGGDVCSAANAVCEEGYYCDGEHCIAKLTAGDMCSPDAPCADDFTCQMAESPTPDAGADSGSASLASCVAKTEVGDPCTRDGDCKSNLCDIAGGATTGVCARVIVLSATEPICANLR